MSKKDYIRLGVTMSREMISQLQEECVKQKRMGFTSMSVSELIRIAIRKHHGIFDTKHGPEKTAIPACWGGSGTADDYQVGGKFDHFNRPFLPKDYEIPHNPLEVVEVVFSE